MACGGDCSACSGCGRELELTQGEIDMLRMLGVIPFQPVARRADDPTPVYLGEGNDPQSSLILQHLERKGLISLDFDKPLRGFPDSPDYPIQGSMALTARGQQVLDWIEYQGIRP